MSDKKETLARLVRDTTNAIVRWRGDGDIQDELSMALSHLKVAQGYSESEAPRE